MIEKLCTHITERLGQDVPHLDEVLLYFKAIEIKRNQQLLRQGEHCRYVYFVAAGCLQVYVHDAAANETTRDIRIENNWCSELISFGSGKPSTENIRSVEPSYLFAINRTDFQRLIETIPPFEKVYKQILESAYANAVYRVNTFIALSALERIKWLMEHQPKLMTRLSSKLIASYLGISQETFSRLKAKL